MATTFTILKLALFDTGTYDRQYSRPYAANLTSSNRQTLDNLNNRIEEATRANPIANISSSLISGLSGGLVIPTADWEKQLQIPNGWDTKRFRFVLQIEVTHHGFSGSELLFYQGYTDYNGVSNRSIDPNMTFFINSFMKVNRSRDFSGMNPNGYIDTITETAQVINGRSYSDGHSPVFGLRPEDLFIGVQSAYMQGALQDAGEVRVIETRTDRSHDVFRSKRASAIPSNFLGQAINTYRNASALADFGQGNDGVLERAAQMSHEPSPYENPFIRAISDVRGASNVTYFTMNDLAQLDPAAASKTDYIPVKEALSMSYAPDQHLSYAGESADWSRPTLNTQIATIVSNAVSGLMIENMLVSLGFHCSSYGGMPVTTPLGFIGMTTADMRRYISNFIIRFESEILPDLTQNGFIPIDLTVHADLYGETRIYLSVDGSPIEMFVVPTFCDSLMTPVVTTSDSGYHGLVNGIESIVKSSGGNVPDVSLFGGIISGI